MKPTALAAQPVESLPWSTSGLIQLFSPGHGEEREKEHVQVLKAGWVQRPQGMMLGSAVLTCALEQHHIFDWTDEMVQVLPHKALALPLGKVDRIEFRMNSNNLYGCFGCVSGMS